MKLVLKKDLLDSDEVVTFCKQLSNRFVIIADEKVLSYADKISQDLNAPIIPMKAKERLKTRLTKEKLEDKMISLGCARDTLLIGIGGGIVSDMVGFIAATYFRGIKFILIPTTLLAMVDASIGGKNGVNTVYGKNLIGTFYMPEAVFIDTNILKTLPKKEMMNGYAEIIKYGLLCDETILHLPLEKAIERAIDIKMNIVKKDFNDTGFRNILNFGHTIGHAIERALNYKISHGQAIMHGMMVESFISYKLNLLSKKDFITIEALLAKRQKIKVTKEKIMQALLYDKKKKNDKVHLVLLKAIAQPFRGMEGYVHYVEMPVIKEALDKVLT
jgi:3-dehydroquinate synthase